MLREKKLRTKTPTFGSFDIQSLDLNQMTRAIPQTLLRSVSVNLAELGPLRPTPAHWSPYTSPDLCGYPSGLDDLGADAPAQSGMSLRDGLAFRYRGGIQRV
jgi:hypothetical protein